jgi:phenylpropionate dioxygenase-like ring-hydroxylating dioxygenase large terminal subunit
VYPKNCWYVGAWDIEVQRELLPRTICGEPVVLYRTSGGAAVALADACWHRLVPLSLGRLAGDDLICGYHGIVYGPDGRCRSMPAQETVNPSAAVRSYPVAEKHRFVWIWPGDPAEADPALIPDLHWNDDPEWAADGRLIDIACDYRLLLDNLMDLTHEQFLHADTLANAGLSEADFSVEHDDGSVTVTRWMHGIAPPPLLGMQLKVKHPSHEGLVDRWQIITYTAPATISIDVGITPAGRPRDEGVNGSVMHTVAPVIAGTCRYFWSFGRSYSVHDQGLTNLLTQRHVQVFGEDAAMLEAQQRAIEANPGHDFYNLNIDAGGMWVRRVLDARIAAEQGRPPTDPAVLTAVAGSMRRDA